MIEVGEFKAISTDEAGRGVDVVLRKRGLHRNADVTLQVAPPPTDEEIRELKAAGHLDEDARIEEYERASDLKIDEADKLQREHQDTAIALAETLARLRGQESARVRTMENYKFGDFSEYLASEVLLVRNALVAGDAEVSGGPPPPPGPPPADIAHPETLGGLGRLTR